MAVSNPAKLSSVKAEFGGPGNLKAYYRGGPYVPNTAANAAISTDPNSLKLSQFAGAVAYTPVSATVSPSFANGINNDQQQATIYVLTTGSPTVTASGGSGTITYAWERVSGSTAIAPVTSNAASTKFGGNVPKNASISADFRCKVSDGTTTAYSPNVTVTLTHGLSS